MPEAVLAVDLGTTRVKAAVVALDGQVLASAEGGYPVLTDGEHGRAEQDAAVWWDAAREAIRTAVGRGRLPSEERGGAPRVVAACVGGQGPSVIAVDESGRPLAPAVIWMDGRSEAYRRALEERGGAEVSRYAILPKAMLLLDRHPDVRERVRWLLQSWDYVAYRMTGSAVASSFRGATVFPRDLVTAAGLDPATFPRELLMGEVGGTLRADVAKDLGLEPGVPVAGGVNDSTATILGTGIVKKGLAIDYGGTSGGLGLAWDSRVAPPGTTAWPAAAPGLWICGGALAAAGRSFVWLLETFGYARAGGTAPYGPTGANGANAALADAARVPAGADGLVFLPYLAGERAPLWDPRAQGVLYGIRASHGREHIARAVLEGVAYGLRHIADVLGEGGAQIRELRVSGGQAKGALWNRIKADVLGVPVGVPKVLEGALLGYAMLAATAAGEVKDAVTAADRFVRIAERIEPDTANAGVYAERYATYRELYPRLRDLGA
ncbi:MAG: xylulokinase [Candidatus Limnocylindria bacterium]